MKQKIGLTKSRLFYIMKKNSMRFRRNTFEVFISQLFLQVAGVYIYLRVQDKNKLKALWVKSFKSFINLGSKCPTRITECLIPMNLTETCIKFHRRIKNILKDQFNKELSEKPFIKQKILREHSHEHQKIRITKDNISNIVHLVNKISKKSTTNGRRISTKT